MEPQRRDVASKITAQVIFGFTVIVLGVLFTLDNLRLIHASDYIRYWPVVLIVVGASKVWQTRSGIGNPIVGFLFMLFGTWLLMNHLGYIRRDAWDFWPVLLIFAGAMIMWTGIRGRQARAAATDPSATLNGVAVLSGVQLQSNATNFRGGELTAFMGGCEIDLRKAAINGDAIIDVFAMWGGIELRVPENWVVINKVTPFMGGVEDKSHQPANAEHRLTIRGLVIMGGVEIKN